MYKPGLIPSKKDKRDALFSTFFNKATLPTIPNKVGHAELIKEWGMLGNDVAGDCVIAFICHAVMLWNALAGRTVPRFTKESALAFYSKITGYDPSDPSTDRGTVIRDMLKYVSKHGIADADGIIHGIGLVYVRMDDLLNMEHFNAAIFLFGLICGGIAFPDYAMQQFQEGKPWKYQAGGTNEGAHCIENVERDSTIKTSGTITWSKDQKMKDDFWKIQATEAWVIISPEMMKDGCNIEGYNIEDLKKYIELVKS